MFKHKEMCRFIQENGAFLLVTCSFNLYESVKTWHMSERRQFNDFGEHSVGEPE